ncbi:MAG TPA: VOC family protein [Streptosporangiaceae bacterium]|nr:VOC family protein [Streptosporangiaceae bacterium]
MDVSYVFAGLVVADRDQAAGWYARLFGRPADMLPNDAEAAWQLAGSASLYLLANPARAGHGVFTLVVDDLDGMLAELAARGIVHGPTEEVGTAGRKCVITDPDGNTISIVELSAGQEEA